MHVQALLILSTAAASVMGASINVPRSNGYVVPDLGDGVFSASFGEDGLVNVTRHDNIDAHVATEVATETRPSRRDLPISRFGCYRASSNRDDWERARSGFKTLCRQGVWIPGGGLRYSVSGEHVAFGCSWGGDNPCSEGEYDDFLRYITGTCGSYIGGWVDMDSWNKQYGMEQRGEAICGKSGQVGW